jgi:hypothetical protein
MSGASAERWQVAFRLHLLRFCALVWFSCWVPPAAAADAQAQAAEALFRQAKALMEKGELEPACEKFAASQALEPGLGTLLYLGDCHERAGQFASALATFKAAAKLAEERNDDARKNLANVRATALEPRVPTLEIRQGQQRQSLDLQVTVNGSPVNRSELGRPVARDAGRYEIRFSAPGYQPFVSRIELKNGGTGSAVINVPRLIPVRGAAPSAEREQPSAPGDADAGRTQRVVAWLVGGTGVALLATAGVFAGLAASKNSDSKADCDPSSLNRCGPEGVRLRNDAKSAAGLATLTAVLGGVALTGGFVLYVTASDASAGVPETALIAWRTPWL